MTAEQPKNKRIEDVQEAEKRARGVRAEVGPEIDREFEKLKLAQSFGLEKDTEDARNKIKELVAKGEKGIEAGRWMPALQKAMEMILENEKGESFRTNSIYDTFADHDLEHIVGPDANCDKFFSFLKSKFPVLELKKELVGDKDSGADGEVLHPGKYAIVEATGVIFYLKDLGKEGGKTVYTIRVYKSPTQASLLRKEIQGQEKKA